MPRICIVIGCSSRSNRDRTSFYSVPTPRNFRFRTVINELSKLRRERWLAAIERADLTESKIKHQKVCSKHFISGAPAALEDVDNPDWVPSLHMCPNVDSNTNCDNDADIDIAPKDRYKKSRKDNKNSKKNSKGAVQSNESREHEEENKKTKEELTKDVGVSQTGRCLKNEEDNGNSKTIPESSNMTQSFAVKRILKKEPPEDINVAEKDDDNLGDCPNSHTVKKILKMEPEDINVAEKHDVNYENSDEKPLQPDPVPHTFSFVKCEAL